MKKKEKIKNFFFFFLHMAIESPPEMEFIKFSKKLNKLFKKNENFTNLIF